MNKIAKTLSLLLILALLILSLPQTPAVAQNPQPGSKISSLLALQVETKRRLSQGELPEAMVNILELSHNGRQLKTLPPQTQELSTQRVFLYLSQLPSQLQIGQLEAMGITLYRDSWIPPVGNHPTGFLVADMPIDKLQGLAAKDYVLSLDSAERTLQPQNDLAATTINAAEVWDTGYDGSGIKIAVLDSGLDVNHPDIPMPVAAKDYSNYPTLDDTIANKVTGHGTHVTGTALGRGTQSEGQYQGMAPGAELIFLKIGNDTSAGASTPAVTNAIKAAVDIYDADIITISYGGWDLYHDGSSPEAQAVDYAFDQGAVVFISAGNEATAARHYSATVPAGAETDYIPVNVGSQFPFRILYFDVVWYDGLGTTNDLDLHYYDSSYKELTNVTRTQSESPRGTESELSSYNNLASPGSYYLKVKNNSTSPQLFHIYEYTGWSPVTFPNPDPLYTICTPADADNAIAVGAYTSRKTWTNYEGNSYTYPGETVDTVSSFSSHGPRVDGVPKPSILAPACIIASCRDGAIYPWPYYNAKADVYPYYPFIIDNDGLNLNGSGPADYFLMAGTSMASPMAAGAAALLLQAHPELKGNPATVRDRLQQTASMAGSPDYISGYGVLDVYQAINSDLVRKGDLDNNGHIDIFDFVLFAAAYGSKLGDPNYNPIGDFNNNGVIDIFDFVNFAQVYGT
jgi:subtilisin family serine protease